MRRNIGMKSALGAGNRLASIPPHLVRGTGAAAAVLYVIFKRQLQALRSIGAAKLRA
jgi:hypothetical protein